MKKVKHVTEYALLRLLSAVIRRLPLRAAFILAWILAAFLHYILRFRVRSARERIRQVFGDRFTSREIGRIAWISWRNICFNVVEIVRAPSITLDHIQRYVRTEAFVRMKEFLASGTGAVLCVPHMGNWDLAGLSAHLMGIPFFFIARRQRNPYTDAYLNKMRQSTGAETIMSDDQRMLRATVRRLKEGMVFAILPDVRSRTPALDISFLGYPANIANGAALFSHLAQVPVIPALTRRVGWFRHDWVLGAPIQPDASVPREADFQRITEHAFRFFEQAIRETPEQYFWYNKRWVLDPLPRPDTCRNSVSAS